MFKKTVTTFTCLTIFLLSNGLLSPAYAYGGGRPLTKTTCDKPTFTDETPAKDSSVSEFSELSFLASSSLKESSLVVKVNGEPIKVDKEKKRTGKIKVRANLAKSITKPGPVLVSIYADDTSGKCPGRFTYRVNVGGEETP